MATNDEIPRDDSAPSSPWSDDDLRRLNDFARALVRDLGLCADDVVAEALAIALRSPPPAKKAAGPWLRGIVRNVVRNARRGDKRRTDRERSSAPREVDDGESDDPSTIAANNEDAARIRAALEQLAAPSRQILTVRFFDGATPLAIARQLGVPAATIRSRILRGISALRVAIHGAAKSKSARGRLLFLVRFVAVAASAVAIVRMTGSDGARPVEQGRAMHPRSEFARMKMSSSDPSATPNSIPSEEELRSLPRRHPFPGPEAASEPKNSSQRQLASQGGR